MYYRRCCSHPSFQLRIGVRANSHKACRHLQYFARRQHTSSRSLNGCCHKTLAKQRRRTNAFLKSLRYHSVIRRFSLSGSRKETTSAQFASQANDKLADTAPRAATDDVVISSDDSLDPINTLLRYPTLYDPIRKPRNPIVLCHGLYGFDSWGIDILPALR